MDDIDPTSIWFMDKGRLGWRDLPINLMNIIWVAEQKQKLYKDKNIILLGDANMVKKQIINFAKNFLKTKDYEILDSPKTLSVAIIVYDYDFDPQNFIDKLDLNNPELYTYKILTISKDDNKHVVVFFKM